MKSKVIIFLTLCAIAFPLLVNAQAQVDPALTGMVMGQTEMLKEQHKKRSKLQDRIIAAELVVGEQLNNIYKIEDKFLNYLSNAQGAVENVYQIVQCAELVGKDIPDACKMLQGAIKANPQGAAIQAVVGKKIINITSEMYSLYNFMTPLVTSGSYESQGFDDKGNSVKTKKKVNLLNSAERYYILNTVYSKLNNICWDIKILAWSIQLCDWTDLWKGLDAQSYYRMLGAKNIADGCKRRWDTISNMKW